MDRRAKKIEKKRKDRQLAKKRARAVQARRPSERDLLVASAASGRFGPCWVSAGWDDMNLPELVNAVVTRVLPDGMLLPGVALVDRTCLGIKNGFIAKPMHVHEADRFAAMVGRGHGGMLPCSPLTAQSIVYHALDYARSLGFKPHRDFPEGLFGPRPDELLATPWHAPERPFYIQGPHDNVQAIAERLEAAVGPDNFRLASPFDVEDVEGDDDSGPDEHDGPRLLAR